MQYGDWAEQLLHALGNNAPDSATINFVSAWIACEGTRAQYNPLATTQNMPGATNFNSVPVRNYVDNAQGIDATVRTIRNGHYPHILEGLTTNKPEVALNHVELGIWGTGGGCVERRWRSEDLRKKELLSHPTGSTPETPHERTNDTTEPPITAGTNVELPTVPEETVARIVLGALGVIALYVAFMLTIRTYVPVQQVVKTIESMA